MEDEDWAAVWEVAEEIPASLDVESSEASTLWDLPRAGEPQQVPIVGLHSSDRASLAAVHREPSVIGECVSLGGAASPPIGVSEVDPPLAPAKPAAIPAMSQPLPLLTKPTPPVTSVRKASLHSSSESASAHQAHFSNDSVCKAKPPSTESATSTATATGTTRPSDQDTQKGPLKLPTRQPLMPAANVELIR